MPAAYMRSEKTKEELQIITLLAVRRFRYTRVPVLAPGYKVIFPFHYWKGIAEIIQPTFLKYVTGEYMPPIEAKPVYEQVSNSVFGTEFGIYAT